MGSLYLEHFLVNFFEALAGASDILWLWLPFSNLGFLGTVKGSNRLNSSHDDMFVSPNECSTVDGDILLTSVFVTVT